ncbi:3-deoxy-7-phosphoheptulonate synthase [Acholeplasma sp. OttesenSCG-928-E16]|nr:3-deoxy-7-phosphoheptulonate synthase [Acholeplasma sp. OttesenSCG-928-E16]
MIVHLKKGITKKEYDEINEYLLNQDIKVQDISDEKDSKLLLSGSFDRSLLERIYSFDAVLDAKKIRTPYQKVLKINNEKKSIKLPYNNEINENNFIIIAGPCSIESKESLTKIAIEVKKAGANFLRGGAFKLRTSPYSFQGLQEEGLKILHEVGKKLELVTVSEITSISQIDLFIKYVDIIQVGARNMYNYELLKELAKVNKPILLKRAFSATIEELLLSAEYLAEHGNTDIILCERGIRTFNEDIRNTLDLGGVIRLKELTFLPVIVDPSHASGRYEMVPKLSKASLAAGADGLMIEVHDDPLNALSDGAQSLKINKFHKLMDDLKKASSIFDKKI